MYHYTFSGNLFDNHNMAPIVKGQDILMTLEGVNKYPPLHSYVFEILRLVVKWSFDWLKMVKL